LNKPTAVAIAIGSNLGDRASHLAFARTRLSALLGAFAVSSTHETAPVDVVGEQSAFLNAAAIGTTTLSPFELLDALLAIERERGRERPFRGAARTLDLDLVFYGDGAVVQDRLIVPHPRFRERRFVLAPLAEIAPFWHDPVTGLTVSELLARLPPAPTTQDR
jgi:2-amino-4-hydroxy-6-hydroxymethyldihydropteridine diphosphokinase